MKKGLTRFAFLLALAASAAFAVRYAPADKAAQQITKGENDKNLGKGTPDSSKDNLAKNGADAKDNLSKGPCAKDNLGVGLL